MIRIYPLRFSRKNWNIKFYSNNNDIIKKTKIRLHSFDKDNPKDIDANPIFSPDDIVIPDNSFIIYVFYPLSYIFNIIISSSDGFSLRELINSVKILYEFIYHEEERTATPQIYSLKKVCSICKIKNLKDYVTTDISDISFDTCPICFNTCEYSDDNDDSDILKLECKHVFHKGCLKEWVKNSGTCPVCRYNIFKCATCNGKGTIHYFYNGVVVPVEQRGLIRSRNLTDGIFGIHSVDMENLILNEMIYDNVHKKLFLNISSEY